LWNNENSAIQLKVTLPNNVTLSIFLHGNGPWIVGSAPDCDLPVRAKGVSRRHLELRRTDGKLSFRDLQSTNGSTLNGTRADSGIVSGESILEIGEAVLRIGGTDTDSLASPDKDSELTLDSYIDILWGGANLPSGEATKKLVNFEFMISQVEKFLSGVAPIDTSGAYANFMLELLQCRGVRLYDFVSGKRVLFAEAGSFPSDRVGPKQLDILTSTGRISGFIARISADQVPPVPGRLPVAPAAGNSAQAGARASVPNVPNRFPAPLVAAPSP